MLQGQVFLNGGGGAGWVGGEGLEPLLFSQGLPFLHLEITFPLQNCVVV